MAMKTNHKYHPTESKYKGGAQEMYVTYDLKQKTRSGNSKLYPKVKRVYIAGDVKDWKTGNIKKRSGRTVHGVAIEYEQSRRGYQRKAFTAQRGQTKYATKLSSVERTSERFRQVLEIPQDAQNIHFYSNSKKLPQRYRSALQNVR
ncbi:MAG TPA: hypothetical protein VJM08_16040 [Anaerolineales bacterium]|nr:hypothetical protein [Anaerolineales bacterium]